MKDHFDGKTVPLADFFPLAAAAVSRLKEAHRQRPFHGCINATTLGLPSAIDAAKAPPLPEIPSGPQPLAYMSPEQTGRMNRGVDYRSDLYSLGVVFYQWLTGCLPFTSSDAMELVHAHIAQLPTAPCEIAPGLPKTISDIVLKLLSKNAEERYQSLDGLLSDLCHCENAWRKEGKIAPFILGENDISDRLRFSHKLYGREEDVKKMCKALRRVSHGATELLLIAGYSGVGKSSLVNAMQNEVVASRGIYLSGKFDQYKRNIPYATLAQALQGFIQQILGSSQAEVERWKQIILLGVGKHGALLTDLIPELEFIIGKQPAIPDLAPGEAEHRFLSVFGKFIAVFAKPAHPLVLFLDDLQWIDAGSMKLLRHLTSQAAIPHLLLIGAYRDNEVEPAHPLMRTMDQIRENGGVVHELLLAPLTLEDTGCLIADALHCDAHSVMPLVELLYAKTAGNPFFSVQFLSALHEEGLLSFDTRAKTWRWDIEQIRAKSFTDNVVDLMVIKLRRLPQAGLDLLQRLACLGTTAPIAILARAAGLALPQIETILNEALRAGLVVRMREDVRFAHDRIQEAAYSLIAPSMRSAMHVQIGRLLIAPLSPAEVDGAVFDLVHQFNRGIELITDPAEKNRLCELNSQAGRKARSTAAYASACTYLAQAIALLPPNAWDRRYDFTFALHLDCAECESVIGNFDQADALLDVMLAHARTNHDRARAARVRIRMYFFATRGNDCLTVGLEALQLFGVAFPQTDRELADYAKAERMALLRQLEGRSIAELIDLPVAADPDVRIVIGLLAELLTPAYSARPAYALPMLLKALQLSLQHGNIEESCAIYSNYGLQLAASFDDIAAGHEFSEMSLRLNERFNDAKLRGRLLYIHGYAFNGARRPLPTCIPLLEQAFHACREVGNVGFAGASADAMAWMALECGKPLNEVLQIAEPYKNFSRQTNSFTSNCIIRMLELLAARLQGMPAPDDETDLFAAISKAGWKYSLGHYHIVQQLAHTIFGRHDDALAAAEQAEAMPSSLRALASMASHYFYYALALAAVLPQADASRQKALRDKLDVQQQKLKQWAASCEANYGDRYALVAAEVARVDGRHLEALTLYESAIASARAHGFVQNEALAHELLARFYRMRGLASSADARLRNARDAYARWGAGGKITQLEQAYPQLASGSGPASGRLTNPVQNLDVITVMKASQAVSGEIVLGRLIESLLKTVVENAGAERGLLILPGGDGFQIAAEATVDATRIAVTLRQVPVDATDVPLSIFNYVVRTADKVLIDDAGMPGPHADDTYARETGVKSVLCLPLVKQGRLVGILHLENRLTTHVFTPGRVAMLELLASQAVISLENAKLYGELQQENFERKRVEEALQMKTAELEAQAAFMNAVIENIPVAVFVKNARDNYKFTIWNKSAEEIFQLPKDQVIGKVTHDLWPTELADSFLEDDRMVARGKRPIDIPEQESYTKQRGAVVLHTIKVPLINAQDGEVDYLLGISEDITERKHAESLIWQQANYDTLTHLPNRSRFREQLRQDIEQCARQNASLAILFIDLDRFKEVNDTLGHDKGDILLIEAARRLRGCVRESDTVARLGGDEFTVILPGIDQPGQVDIIAQNIIDALVAPFQLGEEQAFISASIGITQYPDDATEIENLLKHADQALYVAKDSGRNRFGYFTPALQVAAMHRMRLTRDLRGALDHGEFKVYFQPIVHVASGRIHKAEALIRWQHPQRGLVSPAEFIPLAEASGLIIEIGEWVFHETARWVKRWRTGHHSQFQVSINQSPVEFQRQDDRYDRWLDYLRELDLPGQAIVVEITEGLLLDASSDVTDKLLKLRDAGIQVALDDFGTGYSSLAYLKKFDIDYLKIDQTFTRNLAPGSHDMALSEAIIVMAHKLGLKVIAEGVETMEQHNLLRAAGCDYDQGYLFARPMPADEFDALLNAMGPLAEQNA